MFAIRHKATGVYLPQGKGLTWWEGEKAPNHVPRLFINKRAAQAFQINWAKGRAVVKFVTQSRGFMEPSDDVPELFYEDQGRTRAMLEIIPVTLTFGEPL